MKTLALVLFALVALLATACPPKPPIPVPPGPIDAPPDAEPLEAPATCYDACKRQAALGCIGAKHTAFGASCIEICNAVQGSGVVTWNLRCRANASSCAAADLCEER